VLDLSHVTVIIRLNMSNTLNKVWGAAKRRLRGRRAKTSEPTVPLTLLSLTPQYDPKLHGTYFDAIENALQNSKTSVMNIALTGSYGVGKSSILEQVARTNKRHVISISLSTLGFADEPDPDGVKLTKTNRIQKEIVKQLLYSQDPVRMPGSRYRRMTRFRFWRELGVAALVAVPIAVIFFLAGWTASIAKLFPLPEGLSLLPHLLVFVAAAALVLGLRSVFHNRIQIDQITAGAATITLSAKSSTYFDEYLDEIVYFFEVFDRDIVIFEDIDRFDDPHIFETLRSLNTLLNGAKQLKGRNVRFIYAIKDSIFDELGERAADEEDPAEQDDAAEANLARANRTKFFDLVIPVVPFITHRSARDLLVSTLSDIDHNVSMELIDLAARHVADMRLIKNIRNEFAIFRERIIVNGSLELSEDALLAMMFYKSTHLTDFEQIKLGKSNLDLLYQANRDLVNANITLQNEVIRKARVDLRSVRPAPAHSARLGRLLKAYIDLTVRVTDGTNPTLALGTLAVDDNSMRSATFWEKVVTADDPLLVTFSARTPWGQHQKTVTLSRADIALAVGLPVDASEWVAQRSEELNIVIRDAQNDRDFLAHADMAELAARSEFTLEQDGEQLPFMSIIEKLLDSDLARQLVSHGYVDRNFTLYTSTYYAERVSAAATNFMLKNIDPNVIDMYYELDDDDVTAILRERGESILRERASLNVSVLDYLLTNDPAGSQDFITQLMTYGDDEKALLLAYVESGGRPDLLIQRLASRWSKAFAFLVSDAALGDDARLKLMNVALGSLRANVTYDVDEPVRDYLEASYSSLDALTGSESTVDAALVASLLEQSDAELSDLSVLNSPVREAVVEVGAYAITRENLLLALGSDDAGLALDQVKEKDENVYTRLVSDLVAYRAALVEGEPTIAVAAAFEAIINEIADEDEDAVRTIIERASANCTIDDLKKVPTVAWTPLAEQSRFLVNGLNVKAYIDHFGTDSALAVALRAAGTVGATAGLSEPLKVELAGELLAAADVLHEPAVRAELVSTIGLADFLPMNSVPAETGDLVGDLISEEVISDDDDAFAHIAATDWAGREYAISKSTDFASFMTPTEVTSQQVGLLIESTKISDAVKAVVIGRFTEFTVGASAGALTKLADYAIAHSITLPIAEVTRLTGTVSKARVVSLVEPLLPGLTLAELAPILTTLGGEYRKLAGATGKRPRIDKDRPNRALANRLDALEIVSSIDESGSFIQVNMKRS
jgi:hypothetical protein